jgi:hypothetical protein
MGVIQTLGKIYAVMGCNGIDKAFDSGAKTPKWL